MSSVPSYLWLSRHSIFYFRIVVPGALRPLFPCSEIRRSLQTRCKREALIRGRELLLQVQQLYTQAFQAFGHPSTPYVVLGRRVAVGTAVTCRPPHRSVRAELPHTAPASGS
ncbi:DUF6538 domain-containing protein [Ectopseudomonas oleovorans]|uniref:DUF6538 domain-containing protein n=1 Tax=Ectopseudomonas oleovorans TaxID=301 RepID=UPI003F1A94E4